MSSAGRGPREFASWVALVSVFALLFLAPIGTAEQAPGTKGQGSGSTAKKSTPASAVAKGTTPRTPWGDPDLQGVWHVMAQVPLERQAQYADREFLTDAEVAELDKQKAGNQGRNTRAGSGTVQDVSGAYNAVFNSILKTGKRTSLVIDPKDGKIPPLTEEAQKRVGGRGRGFGGGAGGGGGQAPPAGGAPTAAALGGQGNQRQDNPEDVGNIRCLGVQMPFLPLNTAFAQGTVMRLVQSPKSVSIYMEDDHAGGGTRVIPVDGSPHLPSTIRPYLGDSRGRWEGTTLVVETTNFHPQRTFRGANADTFKMTERYTRVDDKTLNRTITFEDPKTWTRPWTILIEMGRSDDKANLIFDSACHEGNYGLTGILVGSRAEERAEAAKKK
jgi:hypothetical protein